MRPSIFDLLNNPLIQQTIVNKKLVVPDCLKEKMKMEREKEKEKKDKDEEIKNNKIITSSVPSTGLINGASLTPLSSLPPVSSGIPQHPPFQSPINKVSPSPINNSILSPITPSRINNPPFNIHHPVYISPSPYNSVPSSQLPSHIPLYPTSPLKNTPISSQPLQKKTSTSSEIYKSRQITSGLCPYCLANSLEVKNAGTVKTCVNCGKIFVLNGGLNIYLEQEPPHSQFQQMALSPLPSPSRSLEQLSFIIARNVCPYCNFPLQNENNGLIRICKHCPKRFILNSETNFFVEIKPLQERNSFPNKI
jgi:ribosomal protein L37AE/L43A